MKLSKLVITQFSILFALLIGTRLSHAQSSNSSKPNIVIITTDQQFADAMSFRMGKKWIHTPNMDKLASEAMFFTRAYAANPLCVPSRNSIITGQFPHTIGIQANDDLASWGGNKNQKYWTNQDYKSLGIYFRDAGYETAYFGKWHLNYDPKDNASNGFEIVEELSKSYTDDKIPNAVNGFLEQTHQKPLLLWASFYNPHDICQWSRFEELPQGPIDKLPPIDQLPPLPANLLPSKNETEAMALIRESYHQNLKLFPVGDYSHFDWQRLAWGYYRLIEKVDAQIGQLMKVLKDNGYDKNTLFVFTSDHGDCLGAHGFNQKTVFYEESARVPLILKYSGKINAGLNKTLVNTGTDLLPTLLDFAGIAVPKDLPGISLKDAAEENATFRSPTFIVVENKMTQGGPVDGKVPVVNGRMVRGERYKYCLYDILNHREALFDLENDPGETINIAEQESSKDIILKYRGYLEKFASANHDELAINMLNCLK